MQFRRFAALLVATCFLRVLEAQGIQSAVPDAASGSSATLPSLPGKGSARHPFLYCGEWQNRSTTQQIIHIVRDGKIVWSYTNPLKGELGSRQFGASEITPDKKIVWNYDGPPGTEIHTSLSYRSRSRADHAERKSSKASGNQ
jgi:hypothetical protein